MATAERARSLNIECHIENRTNAFGTHSWISTRVVRATEIPFEYQTLRPKHTHKKMC